MWKYSLYPYAKVSTPTNQSLKMLNDAKIFITRHRAFLGIHVISVILAIIFILTSVILSVLDNSGKQCVGELPSNKLFKKLKITNPEILMIGHLNINSIRYKCECLKDIGNNVDILLISKTKLNDTFPNGQFLMNSLHPPFRKDRAERGRGGLLYIQEDVPCMDIMVTPEPNIEAIFVEIKKMVYHRWL